MKAYAVARLNNQDGVGLVSAMLALSLLAVFAVVAASMAVNERRTSFNDVTYTSAFLSADSGGEQAISFLMVQDRPPVITDMSTWRVDTESNLSMASQTSQEFGYDMRMRGNPRPRKGYDVQKFRDFFYNVDAEGEAGVEAESNVSLIVSKLTNLNYN